MCLCATGMPGFHGSPKRAFDTLGQELQMVVNRGWDPNPGPLKEPPVFLTPESSLSLPH